MHRMSILVRTDCHCYSSNFPCWCQLDCITTTATRISIPESMWATWDKTIENEEEGGSDSDVIEYKGKGRRLKRLRSPSPSPSESGDQADATVLSPAKHPKKRQGMSLLT